MKRLISIIYIYYLSFCISSSFAQEKLIGTPTIIGEELIIKGKIPTIKEEIIPSKEEVSKEMIKSSSVSLFTDLTESLKTLPGVASAGDFCSLLYIRGCYPQETRFFLDSVFIYWPYRWGSLLTLFNTNLIKKVDFYAGGYPAKGNQALGGIIDVYYKEGNKKKREGFLEISPTTFALCLEGPIRRNKSSYLLSTNRTHYDLLMKWFGREKDVVFPYFCDHCMKLHFEPGFKDKINLLILRIDEGMDMKIKEEPFEETNAYFKYHYSNDILATNYKHIFSPFVYNELVLSYLRYKGDFDFYHPDYLATEKLNLVDISLRDDLVLIKNNHELRLGTLIFQNKGEVKEHCKFKQIEEGTSTPLVEHWYEKDYHRKKPSRYLSFYVWDRWKIPFGLVLDIGLRWEYLSRTKENLLSPRFGLSIPNFFEGRAKLAIGKYSQYPVFGMSEKVDPLDVLENIKKLSAEKSYQYIIGYEKNINKDFRIKIETYYNRLSKLVLADVKNKAENKGKGYSKGIEFFIQKRESDDTRWDGWLSYSFSESRREVGISEVEQNAGTTKKENKLYPTDMDRPHVVSLVLNYKLTQKWSFNLKCTYYSGAPYTPIIDSISYQASTSTTLYKAIEGEYLSKRLPDYFRADLTLKRKFNLFGLNGNFYIQFLNLTNHKNIYGYYYSKDYKEREEVKMFPFMFLGGVKLKW